MISQATVAHTKLEPVGAHLRSSGDFHAVAGDRDRIRKRRGSTLFSLQAGTFAVATAANGNHVYRQSSLTGDYRALVGNSDWAEQSIEADIRPTAFSGSDRWAGLAVRYLDASNYYYVTLRSSGVVALKSMRNGAVVDAGSAARCRSSRAAAITSRCKPIGTSIRGVHRRQGAHVGVGRRSRFRTAAPRCSAIARPSTTTTWWRRKSASDLSSTRSQSQLLRIADVNYAGMDSQRHGLWNCSGRYRRPHPCSRLRPQAMRARWSARPPTIRSVTCARARDGVRGRPATAGSASRRATSTTSNYYYLTVRSSNTVSLRKVVNGSITVLGTATLSVTPNTWY